mmetsp:Transcript_14298/g.39484  ORF Transcript_14298/g.39484 Transcript_14298/m.39484 type:complete len:134 (-) Transcript_14298:279-680(-)
MLLSPISPEDISEDREEFKCASPKVSTPWPKKEPAPKEARSVSVSAAFGELPLWLPASVRPPNVTTVLALVGLEANKPTPMRCGVGVRDKATSEAWGDSRVGGTDTGIEDRRSEQASGPMSWMASPLPMTTIS